MITTKVNKNGSETLVEFKYRVGDYCGHSPVELWTEGVVGIATTPGKDKENFIMAIGKQIVHVSEEGKILEILR